MPPARRLLLLTGLAAAIAVVVLVIPDPAAALGDSTGHRRSAEAARRVDTALGVSLSDGPVPAGDSEFLRRIYLDLVGRIPTRSEVEEFLGNDSDAKRDEWIDRLLASDDWADLVARRIEAVLFPDPARIRVNAEGKNLSPAARDRARKRFHAWLTGRIRADAPWSEVVAEMVSSSGSLAARPELLYKASFFSGGPADLNIADGMSRDLLGIRISCARCHDHPFDRWTKEDYYQLAAFAARLRAAPPPDATDRLVDDVRLAESDSGELIMPGTKKVMAPRFLTGGERPGLDDDRMARLASILSGTEAGRAQVARNLVNREWAYLLARGFVEPVDDFNRRNQPVGGRALDLLVSDFLRSGESIRFLHRTILGTAAYQRSSSGGSEDAPFSRQGVRQMTPRQLFRSLLTALTGGETPPDFESPAAVKLWQELVRQVRPLYGAGSAWTETTPLPGNARQALFLRNGPGLRALITMPDGPIGRIYRIGTTSERLDAVFLAVLARRPSAYESARYTMHVEETAGFQPAWEDVIWTLLNSTEFVTRH